MKTIYKYLIVAGILILSNIKIVAQSEFILQFNNYGSYLVYWDNEIYHYTSGNLIIRNIFEGIHYLKIYRYKDGPHPYGMHHQKILIYQGNIYIPSYTRTIAKITYNGQLQIIQQEPLSYYDPNPYPYYPQPMSPMAFRQLVDIIDDATFDSNKLQIAEQAARTNYFTARQIATIVELFGFESSRVKFAKTAYHSCIDPGNYFLVFKAFTFSSSIDELNRYINGNQY